MSHWTREWARVLKPGGVAVVVTITTQLFETQVLAPFEKKGLLRLEDSVQFDNKGWTQCRLYTVRRLASQNGHPCEAAARVTAEAASETKLPQCPSVQGCDKGG